MTRFACTNMTSLNLVIKNVGLVAHGEAEM